MVPPPSSLPNRYEARARLACALPGLLLLLSACADSPPPPARTPSPQVAPKSAELTTVPALVAPMGAEPAAEPKPTPTDPAVFAQALAPLRPATALSALQALEAAPGDAQAYAQAALAYAETDVPAMTLIWGLQYQAMGGGAADAKVAAALAKVLNERILVKRAPDTDEVTFNVRLAPGEMPVRQDADGSVHAPLAYAFEALFSTTLAGFRPPWSIEEFHDVLSSWAGLISTRGTPIDEVLELNGWLVTTAKAGHLEALCHQLLGPAFPDELKAYKAGSAAELKALKAYLKGNAFKPKRAVVPDDLVRAR
jgi:hypothetical protein